MEIPHATGVTFYVGGKLLEISEKLFTVVPLGTSYELLKKCVWRDPRTGIILAVHFAKLYEARSATVPKTERHRKHFVQLPEKKMCIVFGIGRQLLLWRNSCLEKMV